MKSHSKGSRFGRRHSCGAQIVAVVCMTALLAGCIGASEGDNQPAGPDQPEPITEVESAIGTPAIVALVYNAHPAPADSAWSKLFADLSKWFNEAREIFGAIGTVVGGIEAGVKVLQFLGILDVGPDKLAMLSADLSAIGNGLTWQALQGAIDPKYAPILGAIDAIGDDPATVTAGSGNDTGSRDGVIGIELTSAWQRATVGSGDSVTNGGTLNFPVSSKYPSPTHSYGSWKNVVTNRNTDGSSNNLVFEWQLGAPFLLKAIAGRLLVMAQIDPNFKTNHHFDTEISMMRSALLDRYTTMSQGIKCASAQYTYAQVPPPIVFPPSLPTPIYGCNIVCADIFSGVAAISSFKPVASSGDAISASNTVAKCSTVAGTQAFRDAWNATSGFVRTKLPLFEMRALIDLLFLILHPGPDLTENAGALPQQTTGLCLEATTTTASLRTCNGNGGQTWFYDRQTTMIRNPIMNTCLTATGAVGGNVWYSPCDANNVGQRWTYDPESRKVQNGYGTVLTTALPTQSKGVSTEAAKLTINGTEVPTAGFQTVLPHEPHDMEWSTAASVADCQRASDEFSISPGDFGFAPYDVRDWWTKNGCTTSNATSTFSCQKASDLYGIEQFNVGYAPTEVQLWYNDMECISTPRVPKSLCQRLSDTFGTTYGVTYGTAPSYIRKWWDDHGCTTTPADYRRCQKAADFFGIVPTAGNDPLGFAPPNVKSWWTGGACTASARTSAAEQCQNAANLYAMTMSASGGAPADAQIWFAQKGCTAVPTCEGLSEMFGTTGGVTWGAATAPYLQSWWSANCTYSRPQFSNNVCQIVTNNFGIKAGDFAFAPDFVSSWWTSACTTNVQTLPLLLPGSPN